MENARLSAGKADTDEAGSTQAKDTSPSNGAKTSEAAPQPKPQQSSQTLLDSKESAKNGPADKEAKDEPSQPVTSESKETQESGPDAGNAQPSAKEDQNKLLPAVPANLPGKENFDSSPSAPVPEEEEKPSSTASKEVAAGEKPKPSSGEPARGTEATAASTSPQPGAQQPSIHSKDIEAIEKEARDGDGEEAEEYRHLLGEGVSTEDIATRNNDKKKAHKGSAPSRSMEVQASSPPRQEPLLPPSIQVSALFAYTWSSEKESERIHLSRLRLDY